MVGRRGLHSLGRPGSSVPIVREMVALLQSVEPASARLEIELAEDVASLRALWIDLAAASENIFSTWEWFELWMRQFSDGSSVRILLCRNATGHPIAIVPLYVARRRPAVLRFAGYPVASVLGPIAATDDIPQV